MSLFVSPRVQSPSSAPAPNFLSAVNHKRPHIYHRDDDFRFFISTTTLTLNLTCASGSSQTFASHIPKSRNPAEDTLVYHAWRASLEWLRITLWERGWKPGLFRQSAVIFVMYFISRTRLRLILRCLGSPGNTILSRFSFIWFLAKDGKFTSVQAFRASEDRSVDVTYTDTKVIGNGSFGVVYQARMVDTGELVAIKKVSPPMAQLYAAILV